MKKVVLVTISFVMDVETDGKPFVDLPVGSKGHIQVIDPKTKRKLKFVIGSTVTKTKVY
jgi:hypothetical protein